MVNEYLLAGKQNAISLSELSKITGMPERSLKKAVLDERLTGILILSSDQGYYLPDSIDDIREYVKTRRAYLKTAGKALLPFKKALL